MSLKFYKCNRCGNVLEVVVDGKVMYNNLRAIGRNYMWLKKEVGKFNMIPEEALIVTFDGKGQIFCQKKERN